MKVGDYVRTKNLGIFKIDEFCSDIEYDYIRNDKKGILINKKEVVKSSPKIIDLIEIGDYVNGCPVLHKENNELICGLLLWYKEENIENVVTKEQFESIEYKVGE